MVVDKTFVAIALTCEAEICVHLFHKEWFQLSAPYQHQSRIENALHVLPVPFLITSISFNPTWISNNIHNEVWYGIIHQLKNFNGALKSETG